MFGVLEAKDEEINQLSKRIDAIGNTFRMEGEVKNLVKNEKNMKKEIQNLKDSVKEELRKEAKITKTGNINGGGEYNQDQIKLEVKFNEERVIRKIEDKIDKKFDKMLSLIVNKIEA